MDSLNIFQMCPFKIQWLPFSYIYRINTVFYVKIVIVNT